MYGLRELLDRSDSAHLSASASVRCSRVHTDRRPHASALTHAHTRMNACVFAAADVVCELLLLDVRRRVYALRRPLADVSVLKRSHVRLHVRM